MIQPFDKEKIVHIGGADHPESIGVQADGNLLTTGTGCQVYRVDVSNNTAEQFAQTEEESCPSDAPDEYGHLHSRYSFTPPL